MLIADIKGSLAQHQVVLITGAAGFFGSHIASRFLRAGKHVVAVDKLMAKQQPLEKRKTTSSNLSIWRRKSQKPRFLSTARISLRLKELEKFFSKLSRLLACMLHL